MKCTQCFNDFCSVLLQNSDNGAPSVLKQKTANAAFCNDNKTCKPDPVPHPKARLPSFIWPCRHRQDLATYPPESGVQPSSSGIRGLSAREVYPFSRLPGKTVGSYPTLFTLTSSIVTRRYMSLWHFLYFLRSPSR